MKLDTLKAISVISTTIGCLQSQKNLFLLSGLGEIINNLKEVQEEIRQLHVEQNTASEKEEEEEDRDPYIFLPSDTPAALAKAIYDPFDYALGLSNGTIIRFFKADYKAGGWIRLFLHESLSGDERMHGVDYSFDRGIDVRISDISWVADAPNGS